MHESVPDRYTVLRLAPQLCRWRYCKALDGEDWCRNCGRDVVRMTSEISGAKPISGKKMDPKAPD